MLCWVCAQLSFWGGAGALALVAVVQLAADIHRARSCRTRVHTHLEHVTH